MQPNHYGALMDTFLAYFDQKDLDGQIAALTGCLALKPNNADLFYFRGFAYFKQKKYGQARMDFKGCVRADPQHKVGHYWLGTFDLIAA